MWLLREVAGAPCTFDVYNNTWLKLICISTCTLHCSACDRCQTLTRSSTHRFRSTLLWPSTPDLQLPLLQGSPLESCHSSSSSCKVTRQGHKLANRDRCRFVDTDGEPACCVCCTCVPNCHPVKLTSLQRSLLGELYDCETPRVGHSVTGLLPLTFHSPSYRSPLPRDHLRTQAIIFVRPPPFSSSKCHPISSRSPEPSTFISENNTFRTRTLLLKPKPTWLVSKDSLQDEMSSAVAFSFGFRLVQISRGDSMTGLPTFTVISILENAF